MTSGPVRRRLLIHVGGYDPLPPAVAHARFRRESRRFSSTWGVRADVSALAVASDLATWSIRADGPDWSVRTEVELLRWDDVMADAARRPAWRRVARGLATFVDFVAGGAFWGYARLAWRYALFFLYPYLMIAVLAGASALAGWAVARLTGSAAAGVVLGVAALVGLLAWAGHRLSLWHLLDDWIFARDYVHGEDRVLSARLDRVADRLVSAWRDGRADEIVVLGHSLGAVLAVDLVDRAVAREPALGLTGPPVVLATVGSSIPKVGLNRFARRFKAMLGRVADAPGVFWVEYQALIDAMNFYKVDPVRELLGRAGGPTVRTVRISRMLREDYYKRVKLNFFRIHNQFVSGNDLRNPYDYFMLCCSPVPVEAQARSPLGAELGIGPDGALVPWSLSDEPGTVPSGAPA